MSFKSGLKMPITPKIKMPNKLKSQAEAEIARHGDDVRILMNSAPQARNAFNSLFTVFINKKIVSSPVTFVDIKDEIIVNNKKVIFIKKKEILKFYKIKNIICSKKKK